MLASTAFSLPPLSPLHMNNSTIDLLNFDANQFCKMSTSMAVSPIAEKPNNSSSKDMDKHSPFDTQTSSSINANINYSDEKNNTRNFDANRFYSKSVAPSFINESSTCSKYTTDKHSPFLNAQTSPINSNANKSKDYLVDDFINFDATFF